MARTPAILTEVSGSIAVIRFNQPAKRNPLSRDTLNELANAVSSLSAREDLLAIIFSGSEDVFASGADIRELTQLDSERAFEFAAFGQSFFKLLPTRRQ
jgi:enoyl-CoA hydratase/carnithine racemase